MEWVADIMNGLTFDHDLCLQMARVFRSFIRFRNEATVENLEFFSRRWHPLILEHMITNNATTGPSNIGVLYDHYALLERSYNEFMNQLPRNSPLIEASERMLDEYTRMSERKRPHDDMLTGFGRNDDSKRSRK
jgi:hypothetical protein